MSTGARTTPAPAPRRLAVVLLTVAAISASPPAMAQEGTPDGFDVVLEGLDFASNIAFSSTGDMFVAEKDLGTIWIVREGELLPEPFATVPVEAGGERGLLGLALHPRFLRDEPWLYAYYTSSEDGRNHIVRFRAGGDTAEDVQEVATLLESVGIHNGGDITFAPDGKLYAVVGDAADVSLPQDPASVGGKVLRLEPDGSIPEDNPFGPDVAAFTIGHRNSFGLCVDPSSGALWETENGTSGDDEVNALFPGLNYGWPEVEGAGEDGGFEPPAWVWEDTVVPTGCAFDPRQAGGPDSSRLYVGDFVGDLHQLTIEFEGRPVVTSDVVVARFPAGISDVAIGPDGRMYVVTSEAVYRSTSGSPPGPTPNGSGGEGADGATGVTPLLIGGIVVAAMIVGLAAVTTLRSRRRRGTR